MRGRDRVCQTNIDTMVDQMFDQDQVENDSSTLAENSAFDEQEQSSNNETIPEGWSFREEGGVMVIVAPDGVIFKSRRHAFEEMIKVGRYSVQDILTMRSCLGQEQWEESEYLPDGWLMRQNKSGDKVILMEQGGKLFKTIKAAFQFVQKYPKYYGAETLERLHTLIQSAFQNTQDEEEEESNPQPFNILDHAAPEKTKLPPDMFGKWLSDDGRCPKGWRYMALKQDGKTIFRYMLPSGIKLPGGRAALTFMVRNNFPSVEIQKMRRAMTQEGWHHCDTLPDGWIYNTKGRRLNLCSPDGQLFQSKDAAIQYMFQLGAPMEHFELMAKFAPGEKMTDMSAAHARTVPEGWMSDVETVGTKVVHKIYSPEGEEFPGRRFALKHLIENDYPEEQVDEMRDFLMYEGWNRSEKLPLNWLFKAGTKMFEFLDPSGAIFYGKNEVLEFLLQDATNNADNFKLFTEFSMS